MFEIKSLTFLIQTENETKRKSFSFIINLRNIFFNEKGFILAYRYVKSFLFISKQIIKYIFLQINNQERLQYQKIHLLS
jgi:hypothetical protein